MTTFFTPDRTTKMIIFGVGAALLLFILLHGHQSKRPNICPIDGRQAEWTKPQNETTCDYGHFSEMEKKPHTWTAPCL
jgi:hypothetical protein